MLDLLDTAAPPRSFSSGSDGSGSPQPANVTSSRAVNVTLSEPLLEYLISQQKNFEVMLQKCLDGLKHDQDERQQSLRRFIHEELQQLNSSISFQVQSGTAELLSSRELQPLAAQKHGPYSFSPQMSPAMATSATPYPEVASAGANVPHASEFPGQDGLRRNYTVTPEVWKMFQEVQDDIDNRCLYKSVLDRKTTKKSVWHHTLDLIGLSSWLRTEMPQTWLARLTKHPVFVTFQTLVIFSNTCLIGYEADVSVKAALQIPRGHVPMWLGTCNSIFNMVFLAELLFRIIALRSWFWVSPEDWGWNVFDVCLVCSSVASDLLNGINLSFIRTLRVLRAVRAARIIRVLRLFRNLRRMLFAILACISSLAWTFVFLALVMFMFSILFVQASVQFLDGAGTPETGDDTARADIEFWFGSLADAMLSLLAAVTGGSDWLEIRKPLAHAGRLYAAAFVVYMLFVTVGVMNVLTGVFLNNANEFVDLSLIVHTEQTRVDSFVEQLLELFHVLDVEHTGEVDWPKFNEALQDDRVRAYFSSLELEPTHVRLIFNLLDEKGTGKITINDLVMGMVRLKGEAKAIDARIIQRELSMLPLFFHNFREYLTSKLFTQGEKATSTDL